MDSEKRFLIAVLLSFLILVFYPIYLKKISPPKAPNQSQTVESKIPGAVLKETGTEAKAAQEVSDKTYTFSHRQYDAEFSEKGGAITHLTLKKWDKIHGGDIVLIDKSAGTPVFLADLPNQGVDFKERDFKLERLDVASGEVMFSSTEDGKWSLVKTYIFDENQPVIRLQVTVQNLSTGTKSTALELQSALTIHSVMTGNRLPPESFVSLPDKINSVKLAQALKKPYIFEGQINWEALCEKYFGIFIRPETPAHLSQITAVKNGSQTLFGSLQFQPQEIPAGGVLKHEFLIYAGPKYYKELKDFGYGFESVLSHGVFGIFKLWLLLALQWAYAVVKNYGWAIILITCVVKLLFTPLTHMSFDSMKKMQALQPKLKSLQERYKDDQATLSREMMELYKKHKVNPLSGCLPMLLQIPIFIAFYQVLAQTPELRGEPFIFWIKDLSEPDRFMTLPATLPLIGDAINILPLLMLGSMFWQQRLSPQTGSSDQQKMMMFMPIMFGFIFYNLPSGLVLYWFVNNLLSIFHQLFIKGKALPHHEES